MTTAYSQLQGILAPNLTPFRDDLSIDIDLYLEHAHSCLEQGCSGLVPFGTTGEASSLSVNEKRQLLSEMIKSGIDPNSLMPGVGQINLPETIEMTKLAMELGCHGVLCLPPFYTKKVTDEGLTRFFSNLIEGAGSQTRLFLYHIPQVAGVGIPCQIIPGLMRDYPEQLIGIKDSSGQWENTKELLNIEGLTVYPGSEMFLPQALPLGAAGAISASANINAYRIKTYIDSFLNEGPNAEETEKAYHSMSAFREIIQPDTIPYLKAIMAELTGQANWLNTRPPLKQVNPELGAGLVRDLECKGFTLSL